MGRKFERRHSLVDSSFCTVSQLARDAVMPASAVLPEARLMHCALDLIGAEGG